MSIKILLVDDHRIIREGLRSLIENEQGMVVAAEAENGRDSILMARKVKPDVVIMDINMPDLNGIDATKQLLEELPEVKVLALSVHSDRRFINEMLKAGVAGYLLKDSAFEELAAALRAVVSGQTYLSPKITGSIVNQYVSYLSVNDAALENTTLSAREREVLQLIAEGWKTKLIADRLHISVKTVETHRQQIMKKLNIYSIAELTKFALREGLTTL